MVTIRITMSSAKVNASEKVVSPSICLLRPALMRMTSRPLMMFSQIPMMNAPTTAPGTLPMPPNTAATKAFRPGMAPAVGTMAG